MNVKTHEFLGWTLHESGPDSADHAVLLLPGGLCSAAFYDDLLAEPKLRRQSIRFVATTLPGHAGTSPPQDVSIESYGRQAAALAAELGCDAVVGHSLGANVALEMVLSGGFAGSVVLLSPSFSAEDESKFLPILDRLTIVLGHLPYLLMLKMTAPMMRRSLPPIRRDPLVAELEKNDARVIRRLMHGYVEYLHRSASLATRLCDAGVHAWVAFGEHDMVKLSDDEREALENCPHASLFTIAGAGHLALNEKPAEVAELVLAAVTRDSAAATAPIS
jgi:pimeloyl-ACP methyl ester carboxylesterase